MIDMMIEPIMHLWATEWIHSTEKEDKQPQEMSDRPIVILENIRSCYNVGNIIRTADALGRSVYIAGYTPSPHTQPKVKKTSLGAEEAVTVIDFVTTQDALTACRDAGYIVIAAEITEQACMLSDTKGLQEIAKGRKRAIVLWNEVVGVEADTLACVDAVVAIPMQGVKESLNVGQTAAIFMWELGKKYVYNT